MLTKDMIIREVIAQYPETVSVFGNFKVDFCCGGSHSIEQTTKARGVLNIDELVSTLNKTINPRVKNKGA